MQTQLSICILRHSSAPAPALVQSLQSNRYTINQFQSEGPFLTFVEEKKDELDCLILSEGPHLRPLLYQLRQQGTLLPTVICAAATNPHSPKTIETFSEDSAQPNDRLKTKENFLYHAAEIRIDTIQIQQINHYINRAIALFLELADNGNLAEKTSGVNLSAAEKNVQNFLLQQQQRLAEKLKERLGYLGVYYKRNSTNFFRNLTWAEKQELLDILQKEYRSIILSYFSEDDTLNERIDKFVNMAFFADLPVTQIVEIHMKLMDEFSKQLKLEGRSEEILLDYRLTLIDLIAHLCEMYRRSIPRES